MSNEERLKWLKEIEKDIFVCSLESTFADDAKSCAIHSAIETLENQKTLQEELEKIYKEVDNIDTETAIISGGCECYGFRPKTAKEMRTEILDIIYAHIKENSNGTL